MKFNKLKGARAEKGYSQKDMADKIGISTDSYHLKENGKTEFKLSEVKKILDILDKEFTDIFLDWITLRV